MLINHINILNPKDPVVSIPAAMIHQAWVHVMGGRPTQAKTQKKIFMQSKAVKQKGKQKSFDSCSQVKIRKKILIHSRFFSFHILHLSFGLRDLSGIALPTAHSCFKMHSILLFIYLSIYIYLAIFLYIFLPIVP